MTMYYFIFGKKISQAEDDQRAQNLLSQIDDAPVNILDNKWGQDAPPDDEDSYDAANSPNPKIR